MLNIVTTPTILQLLPLTSLPLESAQSLHRHAWLDALDHGPCLVIFGLELPHIRQEAVDTGDQIVLEAVLPLGEVLLHVVP